MKILLVHNRYQQMGGEDAVVASEQEILRAAGHTILQYTRENEEIKLYSLGQKFGLVARTVWARDSYRALRDLLQRERVDIVHFHNTFPLVSPSGYAACRDEGIPVVQTLHNYRMFCPASNLFRDGHVCEECLDDSVWRSVLYGCYRHSRPATATVALAVVVHRNRRTWNRHIDRYIALSEFSRRKFIEAGLDPNRIELKPNFVHPDPGMRTGLGEYAIFVGRLSAEKGARTLLQAWKIVGPGVPLVIVGQGPEMARLERMGATLPAGTLRFLGQKSREDTLGFIGKARFLIFPSEAYENFPMVIAEAFACGVPVICSRRGAMMEIVEDKRTGLHFDPGEAKDLADKVQWAWTHPDAVGRMGREARTEFEKKYTAPRNYQLLMDIYRGVIEGCRGNGL